MELNTAQKLILNLYNVVCQLYLKKEEETKPDNWLIGNQVRMVVSVEGETGQPNIQNGFQKTNYAPPQKKAK